jgi:hypothetical protein
MKRYPLLTRDETTTMVGTAALELAEALTESGCSQARLRRLMRGQSSPVRLEVRARDAWAELRHALAHARASGWDDMVEDELAGAASYLGLEAEAEPDRRLLAA